MADQGSNESNEWPLKIEAAQYRPERRGGVRAAIEGLRATDAASPEAILQVEDESGYVSFRRADDGRGLRSLARATERARSMQLLNVELSQALENKMTELATSRGLDLVGAALAEHVLVPAIDVLCGPDEPRLERFAGSTGTGGPTMLLLHGTFSSPVGSFGDVAGFLRERCTFAYGHRTLQPSPVENAIHLAECLQNAIRADAMSPELVLMGFSRGGLVGDLLARVGLSRTERERAYRAAGDSPEATAVRRELETLDTHLDALFDEGVRVARFVRVATPAGGTSLAGERLPRALEVLFNVLGWALKAIAPDPAIQAMYKLVKTVLVAIVRHGFQYHAAPGLSAMHKESPLVRVLAATPPLSVPTTVIGSRLTGEWALDPKKLFWKSVSAVLRTVFREDHDVVVDSASMRLGVPRFPGALQDCVERYATTWHVGYFHEQAPTRASILAALDGKMTARHVTRKVAKRSRKPVAVLFPDQAALVRRVGDEEVWPDVGGFLRRDLAHSLPEPTAEWVGEPYAALEGHFQLVSAADDRAPNAKVLIGHGTGIGRLAEELSKEGLGPKRTVALGGTLDHGARRAALREALESLGTPAQSLEARVSELVGAHASATDWSSEAHSMLRVCGSEAPGRAGEQRGDFPSGWLGASDAVARAVRRFVDHDAHGLPDALAAPRSDELAWLSPDHLCTTTDLLGAALGNAKPQLELPRPPTPKLLGERAAELSTPVFGKDRPPPQLIRVGVLHGAPDGLAALARPSAGGTPSSPALFLLPHFLGEDLSEEARALELFSPTGRISGRDAHDVLPPPGGVTFIDTLSADLKVALLGLPGVRDARPADLRLQITRAVVEASIDRRPAPVIGLPALGALPHETWTVEECVAAGVEGVLAASRRLASSGLAGLPEAMWVVARYEDIALEAGHRAQAIAAVEHLNGVVYGGFRTGRGYYGQRPARLQKRTGWRRWRITATECGFSFEIDDQRAVRLAVRKEARPAAPTLGDERGALEVAGELMPGQLRRAEYLDASLVLTLDGVSAAYPWELSSAPDLGFVALRHGLMRELVDVPRVVGVPEVPDLSALVIGDPEGPAQSRLPGAAREATAIAGLLKGALPPEQLDRVKAIVGGPGEEALSELDGKEGWRVLHIAAHGYAADGGGVLIGGDRMLTVSVVESLSRMPSLVFLNCCEAGALGTNGSAALTQLAGAFMARGTRAFIGAAWPVGDEAARTFAEAFYGHWLDGVPLGRAVQLARAATDKRFPLELTWAAYQCYGDPELTIRARRTTAPPRYVSEREAYEEIVTWIGDANSTRPTADEAENDAQRRALRDRLEQIRDAWADLARGGAGAGNRAPASGEVEDRLGQALVMLGDEPQALAAWAQAIGKSGARISTLDRTYELEARVAFAAGDLKQLNAALRRLTSLQGLRPTPELTCFLAQTLLRKSVLDKPRAKPSREKARVLYERFQAVYARAGVEQDLLFGPPTTAPAQVSGSNGPRERPGERRGVLNDALRALAKEPHSKIAFDRLKSSLGETLDASPRRITADLLFLAAATRSEPKYADLARALDPGVDRGRVGRRK